LCRSESGGGWIYGGGSGHEDSSHNILTLDALQVLSRSQVTLSCQCPWIRPICKVHTYISEGPGYRLKYANNTRCVSAPSPTAHTVSQSRLTGSQGYVCDTDEALRLRVGMRNARHDEVFAGDCAQNAVKCSCEPIQVCTTIKRTPVRFCFIFPFLIKYRTSALIATYSTVDMVSTARLRNCVESIIGYLMVSCIQREYQLSKLARWCILSFTCESRNHKERRSGAQQKPYKTKSSLQHPLAVLQCLHFGLHTSHPFSCEKGLRSQQLTRRFSLPG
jgi:hypothetical protein